MLSEPSSLGWWNNLCSLLDWKPVVFLGLLHLSVEGQHPSWKFSSLGWWNDCSASVAWCCLISMVSETKVIQPMLHTCIYMQLWGKEGSWEAVVALFVKYSWTVRDFQEPVHILQVLFRDRSGTRVSWVWHHNMSLDSPWAVCRWFLDSLETVRIHLLHGQHQQHPAAPSPTSWAGRGLAYKSCDNLRTISGLNQINDTSKYFLHPVERWYKPIHSFIQLDCHTWYLVPYSPLGSIKRI